MSTTKFEHVIGRDGLHRIRLTAENNEIFDASHQGFDSRDGAERNEALNLECRLCVSGISENIAVRIAGEYYEFLNSIPTVDERVQDPLEPQTPGPVEPQTENFQTAGPCPKCGQVDIGQYGEYHCEKCGLPTLYDVPLSGPVESRSEN